MYQRNFEINIKSKRMLRKLPKWIRKRLELNTIMENLIRLMTILLTKLCFVSTFSVYNAIVHKDVSLAEDSQTVQARSPTECVLKCRCLTREAFYTDDGKCVCVDGMMGSINNQNEFRVTGNLYNSKKLISSSTRKFNECLLTLEKISIA